MAEFPSHSLKNSISVPAPLTTTGSSGDNISVKGVEISWDTSAGTCLFRGIPVAMMWVDSTLAGLMSGVAAMVGPDRFNLALQSEGRKSVESDWLLITSHASFREGFDALNLNAAIAGWGDWQLVSYDLAKKICIFRVYNNWEGLYQKALGVCWGSGLLAGKFAGICSKLFETNCWATQTAFVAKGDSYDEFVVTPSPRAIEDEVNRLLETDQATRADMAVALEMLRQKEKMLRTQIADRVKTEEQFRFMLQTSPIAVSIFSLSDFRIHFTNHQYLQLMNMNETQLGSTHPKTFFTEAAEFDAVIAQINRGSQITNLLLDLTSLTGQKRSVQAAFLKILFQGEESVLCWFYDVTELRRARQMAEEAAQVKANFLANMSHEIRTPMNAIIGLSQLALSSKSSEEDRLVSLQKILAASKNLLHILNDVLDFSKVEAGKIAIESSAFHLRALTEQLNTLFSAGAQEKGLALEMELDGDIPLELVGDSLRLNQILSNLLSNAIKFTDKGQVRLRVSCMAVGPARAKIGFSVSDTGIGIPADRQAHLFRAFSQLDSSATRRFGGSGLGLAISRRLLHLMGSDFHVLSQPGQGSTFSFELWFDLATGTSGEMPAGGHKPGFELISGAGRKLDGKKILVVEDDPLNQEVVSEYLQLSGALVSIADNGRIAVALLRRQPFDAVLMDMHMPEMGGLEATQILRGIPELKRIPILALTAAVTPGDRERCDKAGMNAFIPKPIDPEELVNKLVYWVNAHRESELATPLAGLHARQPAPPSASDSINNGGAAMPTLEGFDLTGLRKIMNDERAMIHLLKRFHNHNVDVLNNIKTALDSKQIDAAKRMVHKLKGTSGNLGAVELHRAATTLDAELSSGEWKEETWLEFADAFQQALDEISRLS